VVRTIIDVTDIAYADFVGRAPPARWCRSAVGSSALR
jgi:hypothetical protein